MSEQTTIVEEFGRLGIIPVIKINRSEDAVPLAEALERGGLPAAEITFRSEAAEASIRAITRAVPGVSVCAGTILTVENARRAVDAGAKAVISPGTNPEVVEWCLSQGIPVLPGCATPSEVEVCIAMGLTAVKLFPAEVVGGVKMLKALSGPYAFMQFMPTGGISVANVKEYLALSNVFACGGSWIAPETLIDSGNFAEIERLAKQAAEMK